MEVDVLSKWWLQLDHKKLQQRLPGVLLLLGLILLAHSLATLTWRILDKQAEHGVQPQPATGAQGNSNTGKVQLALQELVNFHLFGQPPLQSAAKQPTVDAPDTRLRLDLKGVFAASVEKEAVAIIAEASGREKAYRIGDDIPGGARLHSVFHDRVILERAGQLETLRLPRQRDSGLAIEHGEQSTADAPVTQVTASQQIRELRDTLLSDPSKIWEKVRINPVFDNGKIKGYTIAHNDSRIMKSLNLSPTDVVTAVNGMPLNDPTSMYGLLGQLKDGGMLQLTVERNGQQQTLEINL